MIEAEISHPEPVDKSGSHFCYARVDILFPAKIKILGLDPLHATFLAAIFLDTLLSATHKGYEVRNADGSKYRSTLGQRPADSLLTELIKWKSVTGRNDTFLTNSNVLL
jgi:hypothetical protein